MKRKDLRAIIEQVLTEMNVSEIPHLHSAATEAAAKGSSI